MATAHMGLENNAEIQPEPYSRPHNHLPDLTTNFNDKIKQVRYILEFYITKKWSIAAFILAEYI